MKQLIIKEALPMSELKKRIVISKDDFEVGKIIDVVFNSELLPHSFIIGGSRWEEFREALGVIDDIDPVVPIENINEISEKSIQLDITKSRLKHKLEEDCFPNNACTYTELKRKKVVDSVGKSFAKITNLVFLPNGEVAFILGGTFFEELSEKMKFNENVDLLLPIEYIESISNRKIFLTIPIEELHLTIDNKPMDEEAQKKYLNSLRSPKQAKMKLFCKRKIEECRDFSLYLYQK